MPITSIRQRFGIFFIVELRKLSAVFRSLCIFVLVIASSGRPNATVVRVFTSINTNCCCGIDRSIAIMSISPYLQW